MNRFGLHVRPAAVFARMANGFRSTIWVAKESEEVDGKSVMALMSLRRRRHEAAPRIEGTDGREAMREIEQLIQSRFEED